MNRAAKNVLRKLGTDMDLDEEREQLAAREQEQAQQRQVETESQRAAQRNRDAGISSVPEEMQSESEKRHDTYRRRQAMGGDFSPAAERLPIMTAAERKSRDKDRPKYHATEFEGPIEKLIEKYGDLAEVQRHLTLGQSMKYDFTDDGRVLDRDGNMIYDGEKVVSAPQ
ncbi:MAG TPA: hypothetical protein QGF95_09225 [Candidatus Latescibacteria bacterium]|jgi:hypothetical protein|nr:hypothetical protein [Candidatus Latescibacterota bacterium]|tara:strand:+ start:814 stop:1320 length:507 start_codon:yes stop_codon:yes gene_type:complete